MEVALAKSGRMSLVASEPAILGYWAHVSGVRAVAANVGGVTPNRVVLQGPFGVELQPTVRVELTLEEAVFIYRMVRQAALSGGAFLEALGQAGLACDGKGGAL